jgi:hypothetical protein
LDSFLEAAKSAKAGSIPSAGKPADPKESTVKLNWIAKQLNMGARGSLPPGGAKSENTSPPIAPCGGGRAVGKKRKIKWLTPFLFSAVRDYFAR